MTGPNPAQDRITACWNGAAHEYDAQPGHGVRNDAERIAWQEFLRDALPPAPADVLDLATGTGVVALHAHALGHRVTGIDLAPSMLDIAGAKVVGLAEPPAFLVGDAVAPPFPPQSFDAITNRHLLWTLVQPDIALANWRMLLRPGGRLLIIDGLWGQQTKDEQARRAKHAEQDEKHSGEDFYTDDVVASLPALRAATVDEIIRMVEAAGFKRVKRLDLSRVDAAEGPIEANHYRYALSAVWQGRDP